MANTAADIQKLYIAYFNRPADPAGLAYWMASSMTITQIANSFAEQAEYKAAFAGQTTESIVSTLYANLFGSSRVPDAAGLLYWVGQINQGKVSLGAAAISILNGAQGDDKIAVDSKVTAATSFTTALDTAPEIVAYSKASGVALAKTWLSGVTTAATATAAIATQDATIASIVEGSATGVVLTNATDNVNGSIFEAGLVYNPAGTDRINALQSEDTLTGTGATGKNTLNATLGNKNDNGSSSVTPTLKNIQIVNVNATGDTNTLDMRFADSLTTLALNKVTAESSSTFTFDNIGQKTANDLSVKNSAKVGNTANFNYVDGVLVAKNAAKSTTGGDTGKLTISNVNMTSIKIGNATNTEGFETLNVVSTGTNTVKDLKAVDAEKVVITGSGSLNMVNNDITAGTNTYTQVNAGGITIGDGIGLREVDATGFDGNLEINVSSALGGHSDPGDSGATFYSTIKTGKGNDTIWSTSSVSTDGDTTDTIDGGEGTDTLRLFSANVDEDTVVTNVEALQLRGTSGNAYISSFDSALKSVLVRAEGGTGSFELHNTTKALAEGGNIVLRHSSDSSDTTLSVRLADASGANDTVNVTVENDLNTGTTFNYEIDARAEATPSSTKKVENVTINDKDTESNKVTLTQASAHTGTVTLTGGTAGLSYEVTSTLVAATIDASTQKSNLILTAGTADQKITLGSGNDRLTFGTKDTFDGKDTVNGGDGTDTIRAFYETTATYAPSMTNVEKFHLVSTADAGVTIDLANAAAVTELALLSNQAVDNAGPDGEPFSVAGTVAVTDLITFTNSKLSVLNYFGDNNNDTSSTTTTGAQVFNAVTLASNTGDDLKANINSSLDAGAGANTYDLGKLTAHGVKNLTIAVGNEKATTGAVTTINDIWGQNLNSVTITSVGDVNLGNVTGNSLLNSITTFNAKGITAGKLTANVNSLGNGAIVDLTGKNDVFSAVGSNGNNIVINGYGGNNTITGADQNDIITTLGGNDIIAGNRGDNTISAGAGDDTITAKDGNNTVNVGTGLNTVTINDSTGLSATKANNSITANGSITTLKIDVAGDGFGATDVGFDVVVGAGANDGRLTLTFTGQELVTALLEGSKAVAAGTNASDLLITHDTAAGVGVQTFASNANVVQAGAFSGGTGDDVMIDLLTAATAQSFSGGAGNDGIYAGNGADTVNGGAGADYISLQEVTAASDTVQIADGDSVSGSWDMIKGFAATAATNDILDLATTTVGTTAQYTANAVTGTNGALITAGSVITNGVLTTIAIADVTGGVVETSAIVSSGADTNTGDAVGVVTLAKMLAFLAQQLNGTGATVAFAYDYDGDGVTNGANDHTIVFQDGAYDTIVDLVGLTGVTAVAGAAAANTIVIA